MKLFYSPTSPYVRKVRVMAIEKGLDGHITLVPCNVQEPSAELLAANPLGRIPTLVPDGGEPLFDSPVICEWLDEAGEGPRLIPPAGGTRWAVLRGQAAADGILDDAVILVLERRRAPEMRNPVVERVRLAAIGRALAWLESHPGLLTGPLTLAQIAVGCALGYLDLRLPELGWRGQYPALAAWFRHFGERPSMQATAPDAPSA